MATPVYVFTGFLDSGKTTLIKDTINDKDFMNGIDRVLLLCMEQGETEYDEKFRDEHHLYVEYFDDIKALTPEPSLRIRHDLPPFYRNDRMEWYCCPQ